jgi:hypothetical protein
MKFWKCTKDWILEIVAAHSAEEAIETIVEFRTEEYMYDEESQQWEREGWTIEEMLMPDSPTIMVTRRE